MRLTLRTLLAYLDDTLDPLADGLRDRTTRCVAPFQDSGVKPADQCQAAEER